MPSFHIMVQLFRIQSRILGKQLGMLTETLKQDQLWCSDWLKLCKEHWVKDSADARSSYNQATRIQSRSFFNHIATHLHPSAQDGWISFLITFHVDFKVQQNVFLFIYCTCCNAPASLSLFRLPPGVTFLIFPYDLTRICLTGLFARIMWKRRLPMWTCFSQ